MSNQPIQLPDFLIADLYKHSIVVAGDEPVADKKQPENAAPVAPAPPVAPVMRPVTPNQPAAARQWYLGSNLQKITLMVSEKDAVHLGDESLNFLTSILGACKLNLGDVAIVNFYNEPVDYHFLKENLAPGFLLFFGVTAQQVQLPFTVPYYQVQKYDNRQFLLAPDLSAMLGNSQEAKLEKSKLWLSLKKMFNL